MKTQLLQCSIDSSLIASGSEAADDGLRKVGEERLPPEGFPSMHIGKMNLYKRKSDRSEGVTQCDTGMCEGRRVDDDEPGAVRARKLHTVDKFALAV